MKSSSAPSEAKTTKSEDIRNMRAALSLARRGLGNVWPNPAVGCVLVKGDRIVGRGWTQPSGRPHAETEALRRAGAQAQGATAYVTLEPCNHTGETPPCAQALIDAGIKRVVVATADPDERVQGRGIERLKAHGIDVDIGCLAEEADDLNAGFFLRINEGRPLFTLKTATSLDGRIAASTGRSRWITGDDARAHVHGLRASHDAVMVGIGTALADDPDLTCRLPGLYDPRSVRIVLDGRLRIMAHSHLVTTARESATWIICGPDADPRDHQRLAGLGVNVVETSLGVDGRLAPMAVAEALGAHGLTRVLIEGGGKIAAAWLHAGLVDRMSWFRAPMVIGGDGVPAVGDLGVNEPKNATHLRRTAQMAVGVDSLETYRAKK